MGNRKNKLSWSWPLISYDWIPEILSSFDHLIEPTWGGLQREMGIHVVNKPFSNRITRQIQTFLTETGLAQTTDRRVKPAVKPTHDNVKKHLTEFLNNNANYARFYQALSSKKHTLNFEDLKDVPPKGWKRIAEYPVFKQWSLLYQYIGYGFLLNHYQFIPSSVINTNMANDEGFKESSIKCFGDPRLLTGYRSLHRECDYFAWTKGEERLPITSDINIAPRIPSDTILNYWEDHKLEPDAWQNALALGKKSWHEMINSRISSKLPFDLETFIFTCKKLVDLFLFGQSCPNDDFIDKEQIHKIKKQWESVSHYVISIHFWKGLPRLYQDITRLYWGAFYFRNSLKRPTPQPNFDNKIFETEPPDFKEMNIRSFRSKRTFQSMYQSMILLHNSLRRLLDKNAHKTYQNRTQTLFDNSKTYLPANPIDITEQLYELEEYLVLNNDEKALLTSPLKIELPIEPPKEAILQLCHWVHCYNKILQNSQFQIITTIQKQLHRIELKFITEIKQFNYDKCNWNLACQNLKKVVELNRSVQK